MSILRYELCLSDIIQGGTLCKNPTIRWEGLDGVEISCPYNDNCKCVEIQVPSDAAKKCFNVLIDCEDCDKCPTQVITKCLCDTTEDCDACEICIDGICQSRCPDKICDTTRDICVDCTDSEDCPDGKICVGGKCVCPPDKPYLQPDGRCTSCVDDTQCPDCTRCVDGECVPIDCGTGVCDPEKNECVGCVQSGDCTGVNQCCVDGKCECCDGYVYNYITGTCDPLGECTSDNDCPECYICVGDECVPRVCPTGYVCIDDECKKTCACSEGPCSKTEACVPHTSDLCYCEPCGSTCDGNGDCGYGCFCDSGNCKPNPCSAVVCGTSLDCGDGCGCYDGVCTPCNSLGCATDECGQVEGCKCLGALCKQDPCSGPCENGADCGDGCGCIDGVCTSCDKQSCVGNDCKDVLGCECVGNNCVDKQGCDGGCNVSSDCAVGCTCYQGECTPCVDFPCDECDTHDGCACLSDTCVGDGTECDEADIIITRVDTCELKGSIQLNQCCTCEPIDYVVEQKKNGSNLTFSIGLYKFGTKLSELPIQNEDEYVGQFKLTVRFGNMAPIVKFVNITPAVLSKDTIVFPSITIPNGSYNYNAKVEISNSLEFENKCIFNKRLIGDFYNTNSVNQPGQITSDSCRTPVFTWYMSSTTTFGSQDILRQVYVNETSPGLYEDILNVNQGLQSDRYFQLDVDCSCAKTQQYASACEKPGKLFYCNPTEFNYVLSNCNKRITFSEVRQCMTNVVGEVQWELLIKTAAVPTYTVYSTFSSAIPNQFPYQVLTAVLIPGGTVVTTPSTITGIKFRIKGDPCSECEIEDILEQDPGCCLTSNVLNVSSSCANNGVAATVTTSGALPVAGCVVELYKDGVLLVTSITDALGGVIFSNLTNDDTYEIDVNSACDPNNCIEPVEYLHTCAECPTKTVTANYSVFTQTLNIMLSSVVGGNTYTYTVDGIAFIPNPSVIALTNGIHNIVVTETYPDSSVCQYTGQILVNNCPAVVISSVYVWDPYPQALGIISISGGTPNYSVSFANQTFTNITPGGIQISTIGLADGNYPLLITDANGCSSTFSVTIDNCSQFEGNGVVDCDLGQITLVFNNGTGPYNYVLRDGANNIVTSGPSIPNIVTVAIAPESVGGTYRLVVQDSLGCSDTDEFEVECLCFPAPSVDIGRVQVAPDPIAPDYSVIITLGDFENIAFPISITLYEELCSGVPTTPFVVINDVYVIGDVVAGELAMTPFSVTIPPDPEQVSLVLTDANGCTVCRNVTLIG